MLDGGEMRYEDRLIEFQRRSRVWRLGSVASGFRHIGSAAASHSLAWQDCTQNREHA